MIDFLADIPLWLIFSPFTVVVAYFKGRRLVLWGLLGYFMGPVALVIVLVRETLPRKQYKWLEAIKERSASNEVQEKFEHLGTPEDFLQGIDQKPQDEK
jgi:hypothetical protein